MTRYFEIVVPVTARGLFKEQELKLVETIGLTAEYFVDLVLNYWRTFDSENPHYVQECITATLADHIKATSSDPEPLLLEMEAHADDLTSAWLGIREHLARYLRNLPNEHPGYALEVIQNEPFNNEAMKITFEIEEFDEPSSAAP